MTTIAKNQGQKSQNGICAEVIFELADSMTWAQTDTYASIFLPLGKCPKYMIKNLSSLEIGKKTVSISV